MNNKAKITDFSSLSVICSVDKFVKTVEAMNETIMVPSRLLNVEVNQNSDVPELLRSSSSDPYTFFTVLNDVKNNLIWGLSNNDEEETEEKSYIENIAWIMPANFKATTVIAPKEEKGHSRRISSVSMGSFTSCSSEVECERLSDGGDSGVEPEDVEPVVEITSAIRSHLVGLQQCLNKLTETAKYIMEKYQEEVSV